MTADAKIRHLLQSTQTIAVVGLSDDPSRPSHYVSKYMQSQGYRIIPVNPTLTSVLGERSYPTLKDIPEAVDMVNVFRRPDAVPPIVQDAIAIGAKSVWMQQGIVHEDAGAAAEAAGLTVVMDRCLMVEHGRVG
jgi:predicted CoA-binding protein